MFSRLRGLNKLFVTAFIPGIDFGTDHVDPNTKTAFKMAIESKDKVETGVDRLYMMFTTDEFGTPSPELVNISQMMMLSLLVGGGIGGFIKSRYAFLNFIDRNDATSFASHLDAKKRLQDSMYVSFVKGAWQWGWRLSVFTGAYTAASTSIAVYRGENGILEHILGGMLTGVLYKLNLGIRGIVVGGALGAALGTFSGLTMFGILKLTGVSIDDVRKTGYWMRQHRDKTFQSAIDDYIRNQEPKIAHAHDARVGENNSSLDTIPSEPTKPT